MRRKKNKGKIGVLFIVSAMLLAGIGVAYSAWTDTIYISGTVTTGDVDINIVNYSGTWVWKDLYDDDPTNGLECVVTHDPGFIADYLIAWAEARPGVDPTGEPMDDAVTMEYFNLFPCIDFMADVVLHYEGSIPAKVQMGPWVFNGDIIDIPGVPVPTDWLEWAYANGYLTTSFQVLENNSWIDVEEGYQLHYCYLLKLIVTIHIPQLIEVNNVLVSTDFLMNLNGSFTFDFEVVQWNEYPYLGGDCGGISGHADVVLAVDTSYSVYSGGGEGFARNASKAFCAALLSPDDANVSLVSWDDTAYLETTFTKDLTLLNNLIDALVFDGGSTNLTAAIVMSQDQLDNYDRTPDVDYPDYMVIITDGLWNVGGDPQGYADAAKAAGTLIYVLGVGIPDPTILIPIASPGCYYDVTNWSDLESVLLSII